MISVGFPARLITVPVDRAAAKLSRKLKGAIVGHFELT